MISKALICNVKQYKKRDASLDQNTLKVNFKAAGANGTKLPHLVGNQRYMKSKQNLLEPMPQKKKAHSRMQSFDSRITAKPLSTDPKERARLNLVTEFGRDVDNYLKKLEDECKVESSFL